MAKRAKVFISGPYTKGDPCANTHAAIRQAQVLLDRGYAPFVPHLTHFWHTMIPNPYQVWLDLDMEFLEVCDILWRMPGESPGADKEVERAKELHIPVVTSMGGLTDAVESLKEKRGW